ncbi:hypothetical protein [Ferrimonas gelatinilytica]|uniref:Crp/Fnr family transcriptional regulator n=1 Tax=Ferrimonas gelatinilytica TaxID=1255257 RepID=UPI0031E605F7
MAGIILRLNCIFEVIVVGNWVTETLPQRLETLGLDSNERLGGMIHSLSLAKGETLCPSSLGIGLALLRKGTLMRQVGFHDGTLASTELLFSGHFIFPRGVNREVENNVTHRALEKSELEWLGLETLYRLCRQQDGFLEFYLQKKNRYSRTVEDHLLLRSILSKKEHLIFTLCMIFSARLRRDERVIPITLDELCTMTGTTRQYCTKVVAELCERQILINHYGSLELVDYGALKGQMGSEARRHYDLIRAKPQSS